jgi:hypothetical protein
MGTLASFIVASAAFLGGLINQPSVMQSVPPQMAMMQGTVAPLIAAPVETATIVALAAVAPNLLPTVTLKIIPAKVSTATKPAPLPKIAATTPVEVSPKPPAQTSTPAMATITAQSFLNATTLTPVERRDGPYEIALTTDLGGGNVVHWDLIQTTIGGGSVPTFSTTNNCDPNPIPAVTGESDQNPMFTARVPYTCTILLTPLTGNDLRTQSKQFTVTIPPGQFIVTPPSAMNTVLKNNENDGGFVFTNEDVLANTVTAITLDVSYTGLTNIYGPLVLRVVDPATEQSVGDYHLENVPADANDQYTHHQNGITLPISFKVFAGSQKLLPIQVLGVQAMSVSGVNPNITITLRGVTTDHGEDKLIVNSAIIRWNCVVTFASYDPNATSGALVSGNACGVGGN